MAAATEPTTQAPPPPNRKYKMKLYNAEFHIDFGGRLPQGAVVLVDEPTAIRWYENGVADMAPPDATTYAEEVRRVKREEFLKRAQPVEGVFDEAITRTGEQRPRDNLMPPPMPVPARRGRRPAGDPLAMAPVLTDPDEDDEA